MSKFSFVQLFLLGSQVMPEGACLSFERLGLLQMQQEPLERSLEVGSPLWVIYALFWEPWPRTCSLDLSNNFASTLFLD